MNNKNKSFNFLIILPMLFPYLVFFAFICIFSGIFMKTVFQNNALYVLLTLFIIFIFSLICSIILFINNIVKKKYSQKILFTNMFIKLIQIPAYVLIFLFGLINLLTIFTAGINIFLIILNCMSILLTGLIGLSGIIRSFLENKLSIKYVIINGIFQFIFCFDIISCIIVYKKIKRKNSI